MDNQITPSDSYVPDTSPMLQCPHVNLAIPVEEVETLLTDNFLYYSGELSFPTLEPNWRIDYFINPEGEKRYYVQGDNIATSILSGGLNDYYVEFGSSLTELLKRVPLALEKFVLVNRQRANRTLKRAYDAVTDSKQKFDMLLELESKGISLE